MPQPNMTRLLQLTKSFLIILLLTACSSFEDRKTEDTQTFPLSISGRDQGLLLERPSIYRVNAPVKWTFKEPSPSDSLADTKKPIYEMVIYEGEEQVLITIHNFPAESINTRIPPEAQVSRWKQQLGGEKAENTKVDPQSFGGFSGLRFEGQGKLEGKERMVIGWSMQISPEHFYALSQEQEHLSSTEREQMRADYTIKVVGPPGLIQRNKNVINNFARSFRLITPIPKKR